jgi:hypothetical protein
MSKRIDAMITDLLQMVEKELGRPLPGTSAQAIKTGLSQRYGGERVYIPAWPKAVARFQINSIGASLSTREAAARLGFTQRQVQRLRKP